MRILFIRHAEAVEASEFRGKDEERPLTAEGRKRFAKVAASLAKMYPKPDRLLSSFAVRAVQTAELVAEAFDLNADDIERRAELNPGAGVDDIKEVLKEKADAEWVFVVGHEPDFSKAVSALTANGELKLKLKKGGVAEVDWPGRGGATLRALLDPARL